MRQRRKRGGKECVRGMFVLTAFNCKPRTVYVALWRVKGSWWVRPAAVQLQELPMAD